MQRVLPLQAIALLVCLLGCSESGTRSPTAPSPPPPLAAALAPAADTVQVQVHRSEPANDFETLSGSV